MARGTPLAQLYQMFCAEVGSSLTIANANDKATVYLLLANQQKWLATQYDWPNLEVRQDVALSSNSRFGPIPGIDYERPVKVEIYWNSVYQPVLYGVGSEEYNTLNPDLGQALDPVQRWRIADQVEVAPPSVAPAVATSGTGITGTFSYAVTFLSAFGETSIGPSISTGAIANKTVNLTAIPTGTAVNIPCGGLTSTYQPVIGRNIYRTKNGGTVFYLVGTLNDNITTVFNDSTADASLVTQPPTYSTAEITLYELWPMTVGPQTVRFTGQRVLSPLVQDTDTADLDDMMIVFFAASNWLARKKQADSQLMLQKANERLAHVRSSYPRRSQSIVFGGNQDRTLRRVVPMIVVAGNQTSH